MPGSYESKYIDNKIRQRRSISFSKSKKKNGNTGLEIHPTFKSKKLPYLETRLNKRKLQNPKALDTIHADEVKELSYFGRNKNKKVKNPQKLYSNIKKIVNDKGLENTKKKYVVSSDRVKQEPTKDHYYKVSESEYLTPERVANQKELDVGEEELTKNSSLPNQRNEESKKPNTSGKISQESMNKNVTSGKAEILIDSIKHNSSEKTIYKGKPIGMEFLYEADKLSCIVKCHSEDHLLEARTRVSREKDLLIC